MHNYLGHRFSTCPRQVVEVIASGVMPQNHKHMSMVNIKLMGNIAVLCNKNIVLDTVICNQLWFRGLPKISKSKK